MHSRGSSVRTTVCEKMDCLEDSKSLLWQGQVPVKDERAEGRLGTRGRWASGSSAGVTAAAAVPEPPTVGAGWGWGGVPGRDSREGRSGFLAQPSDALIKPRVHFPAQLSTACCASQE